MEMTRITTSVNGDVERHPRSMNATDRRPSVPPIPIAPGSTLPDRSQHEDESSSATEHPNHHRINGVGDVHPSRVLHRSASPSRPVPMAPPPDTTTSSSRAAFGKRKRSDADDDDARRRRSGPIRPPSYDPALEARPSFDSSVDAHRTSSAASGPSDGRASRSRSSRDATSWMDPPPPPPKLENLDELAVSAVSSAASAASRFDQVDPSDARLSDALRRQIQTADGTIHHRPSLGRSRLEIDIRRQPRPPSDEDGLVPTPTSSTTPIDHRRRKRVFSNRTKTGCMTCRRRKKKCDEQKPECTCVWMKSPPLFSFRASPREKRMIFDPGRGVCSSTEIGQNCVRGGFVCEGYSSRVEWLNRRDRAMLPIQAREGDSSAEPPEARLRPPSHPPSHPPYPTMSIPPSPHRPHHRPPPPPLPPPAAPAPAAAAAAAAAVTDSASPSHHPDPPSPFHPRQRSYPSHPRPSSAHEGDRSHRVPASSSGPSYSTSPPPSAPTSSRPAPPPPPPLPPLPPPPPPPPSMPVSDSSSGLGHHPSSFPSISRRLGSSHDEGSSTPRRHASTSHGPPLSGSGGRPIVIDDEYESEHVPLPFSTSSKIPNFWAAPDRTPLPPPPPPPPPPSSSSDPPALTDFCRISCRHEISAGADPMDMTIASPSSSIIRHRSLSGHASHDNHHDTPPTAVTQGPSAPPLPSIAKPPTQRQEAQPLTQEQMQLYAQAQMQARLALSYQPKPMRPPQTDKEKMMASQPYLPSAPELASDRERCKISLWRFNQSMNPNLAISRDERVRLFREILRPDLPNDDPSSLFSSSSSTSSSNHHDRRRHKNHDDHKTLDNVVVEAPFNCDYGYNIHVEAEVQIGINCTIMDACSVTIGARSILGPNVSLLTSTMPVEPHRRSGSQGPSVARPIHIEEDCFIGAGAMILLVLVFFLL